MRPDTSSTNSTETTDQRRTRKRARTMRSGAVQATPPEQADSVAQSGLTGAQIQRLHQRLLEERAKAMRAIWVKRADMEDHRARGELDELEWDIRMAERQMEFIVLIEDALRRLRESPIDFDISEASGARIPFERLELVPWTRRLTHEADPLSIDR
jgi:RNA polymerase-binding transcription factor DksA